MSRHIARRHNLHRPNIFLTCSLAACFAYGILVVAFPANLRAECNNCPSNCCPNACPSSGQAAPAAPGETQPAQPGPQAQPNENENIGMAASNGSESGDVTSLASIGGYIDSAIIRTRLQVRYDKGDGADSDRAEFMYGAWSQNGGPVNFKLKNLNFQDVSTYFEYATSDRFSGFVEVPVQWNNIEAQTTGPGPNGVPISSASGLGDVTAGFRYGLINECDRYVTFQLKVFTPTGDAADALGTGHVSIEPGLLFQRESCRWTLFGEFDDWIGIPGTIDPAGPFAGDAFTGNVLMYGLGLGYDLYNCPCRERKLTGVVEFVGWTVLSGLESNINGDPPTTSVRNAAGETVANIKVGARYTAGSNSLYVGYGVPMTGDVWYNNILRVQYEFNF